MLPGFDFGNWNFIVRTAINFVSLVNLLAFYKRMQSNLHCPIAKLRQLYFFGHSWREILVLGRLTFF
jgi:hypothetical protein